MKLILVDETIAVNGVQMVDIYATTDGTIEIETVSERFTLVELDEYDDNDAEDRALLLRIYGAILDDLIDPTVVRVDPDQIADRFLTGS